MLGIVAMTGQCFYKCYMKNVTEAVIIIDMISTKITKAVIITEAVITRTLTYGNKI